MGLKSTSGMGYGQTWKSITRVLGTTYYNTKGKPIAIVINNGSGSTNTTPTINGVALPPNYNYAWTTFIVPVGGNYSVASTQPGGQVWAELS